MSDLKFELGSNNIYDFTAQQALLEGRQYQIAKLEQQGQKLAENIQKYPYDSDQFFQVISQQRDIRNRLSEIRQPQFEKKIQDWTDRTPSPWKYQLQTYSWGTKFILEKWNTDLDGEAQGTALQIEKKLDQKLQINQNPKRINRQDFGACSYETRYYDGEQGDKKEKQFHAHQNGDVGYRIIYEIANKTVSEPQIKYFWTTLPEFLEKTENKELPEKWQYSPEGGGILIPKSATLIEKIACAETKLNLYSFPSEEFGLEAGNNFFYAITGQDNKIKVVTYANEKIGGLADIKSCIQNNVGIIVEDEDIIELSKIPIVFDKANRWIFVPISKKAISEMAQCVKSPGPSGTHYLARKINIIFDRFFCDGSQIKSLVGDDELENAYNWDLIRGHDGKIYVQASAQMLGRMTTAALATVGVLSSDQMPLFQGKGSLIKTLNDLKGFAEMEICDDQNNEYYSQGYQQLRRQLEENISGAGINFKYVQGLFKDFFSESEVRRQLLNTSSNYNTQQGIPMAAVLVGKFGKWAITMSNNHPNAETEALKHQKWDGSELIARIDGNLKMSAIKGEILQWEYDIQHLTDQKGAAISELITREVQAALRYIAAEGQKTEGQNIKLKLNF